RLAGLAVSAGRGSDRLRCGRCGRHRHDGRWANDPQRTHALRSVPGRRGVAGPDLGACIESRLPALYGVGMTASVGLTGGVASGKTTVANAFSHLGVPVVDADQLARDVVAPGEPALDEIVQVFGTDILDDSGALSRPAMRKIVFND